MSDDAIPQAVSSATINLLGVNITVYHLDDGRRVIAEPDMLALFEAMAGPDIPLPEEAA